MYKLLFFTILLFVSITCVKDKAIHHEKKRFIEVFIKNLKIPWGMAFLPNGDFIFCQRDGQIDLLKKGESEYNLIMFRIVKSAEGGLLGLAIDPDFVSNQFVYIYETVTSSNQLVRLRLENDLLTDETIIIPGIPSAYNHDGGALRFGPDGFLYLGTGDALQPDLAQDKNSLAGKILRVDKNGDPVPGNPFNNRVWSYGHRNVQGFDWNKQGKMISTEHGPTIEFGWCCHDEINLIEPGKNYGWPLAMGGTETDSLTPALYQTGMETWAPSGCTFIKGNEWGNWEGNFIFCCLRGQRLVRFDMNDTGDNLLARNDTLIGEFLRLRNIIQAPDGSLLFTSSNIGTTTNQPLTGDDKIYRMFFK